MTSRPGPGAARRLLQPTQPASTTAGPSEPRLRCNGRRRRALARVVRFTLRRCSRAAVGPSPRTRPKPCSTTTDPAPSTGGAISPAPGRPCGLPRTFAERGRNPIRPRGRPPVEVSRARSRRTFVAGASARVHPFRWGRESFIPTRSARTPLVVRPRQRRLETSTLPGADPVRISAHDDPTPRAPPPRRVGARGPSTTRLRGAAGRALRCRALRLARSAAARMRRLRGRIRGRGPHHPPFREEEWDLPHPRCLPSMSRPPSSARRWDEPGLAQCQSGWGRAPPVQPGERVVLHSLLPSCGELPASFFNLAGSAALDGAMGRRSGGASGGSDASTIMPGRGVAEAKRDVEASTHQAPSPTSTIRTIRGSMRPAECPRSRSLLRTG